MTKRGKARADDGTKLAFDVVGQGPPMIFVHGMSHRRQAWDPVTQLASEAFTCIRMDARGHGESGDAPGSEYGAAAWAGDVWAVADHAGAERPALVGHSAGGFAVAIAAAMRPVTSTIVVDQLLKPSLFAAHIAPFADRLEGDDFLDAFIEISDGLSPEGPSKKWLAAHRLELAPRRDVVLGSWKDLLAGRGEELDGVVAGALGGVQGRLMAVHGSEPPAGYTEWLSSVSPQSRVTVWPDLGHFLHLVEPARFGALITRTAREA